MDTTQVANLPIEKVVENDFFNALKEHEIRKDILIEQRDECLSLKINDLTDKENYTLVRQTRLNQKAKRIIVEKVCKAGRDGLVKAQKAWIGFEKEFTDIISSGEKYLQGQEDLWDAEIERKANERKLIEEKQFSDRSTVLQNLGAKLIDGNFVLDSVSYEAALIRETEQSIWEGMILPKYKSIFDEKEAIRIVNEKKLAQMELMRTTVYKARYATLLEPVPIISDDELIDMTDEDFDSFKSIHNTNISDAKTQADKQELLIKRTAQRLSALYLMGFSFNGVNYATDGYIITVDELQQEDCEWDAVINKATDELVTIKKNRQDEKIKEQELADKKTDAKYRRNLMLGFDNDNTEDFYFDMDVISWAKFAANAESLYKDKLASDLLDKQKSDAALELLKKQEEDSKQKDNVKWLEYCNRLSLVSVPEFKTKKYQRNIAIAKDKIEEIRNL